MVQQAIQQALETWVENGRDREAIVAGRAFVLRYGSRFKLQCFLFLAIFAFFFGIGLVVMQQGGVGDPAANLACVVLFGCLTAFSSIYVAYALTIRVEIDDAGVTVVCFGRTISQCKTEMIESAYKAPLHASVVLRKHDGTKTRISTQLDGLRALVAWLQLRPEGVLNDSILSWMETEAPDLIEPPDARDGSESHFRDR